MKSIISSLCALAVLCCVSVSCGGANARVARPRVLVGDRNTPGLGFEANAPLWVSVMRSRLQSLPTTAD